MKRLICVSGLLVLFMISKPVTAQKLFSNPSIGINLPPLIGNTLDIRLDTKPKESLVFQTGIGVMLNNTLPGSYAKVDDGTDNHNNSGVFASVGLRHLYFKGKWSHFYFGYKIIGGYYYQYAETSELKIISIPVSGGYTAQNYIREFNCISASGPYMAAGIELLGAEFIFKKRVIIDLGFQLSKVLYRNEGVLSMFSVFPGTGALGIQGTLSPKIMLGKRK